MQVSCLFVAEALHQARNVLLSAARPDQDVLQVIWFMTDYYEVEKHHENVIVQANILKCEKVLIFGHGGGSKHNANETKAFKELVSKPHQCYYDNQTTIDTLAWQFTVPKSKRPSLV